MMRALPGLASALALAAWIAFPQTAPAQTAPVQEAPPSPAALVAEVEVIGRLPGPALWRVSTPTSQLWILGVAGPLPKDFQWDNRRVATALDGARELVLPPEATGGLGDVISLLLDRDHVIHLPRGETVRGVLPPDLKARWEAAAHAIDRDPAHYDHWRPVIAAGALQGDAVGHYHLNPGGVMQAVAGLARSKHVKVRPMAVYGVRDLIRGLGQTPPEAGTACIDLVARSVESAPEDAQRRAAAWAKGDLKTLKALNDGTDSSACIDAIPAVVALRDRAAADTAKGLAEALATPGKTVVASDLVLVTRKGGLLDQLKAEGLEVIGPAW
jgi:uncharacterized protein YbaP (TraB family)